MANPFSMGSCTGTPGEVPSPESVSEALAECPLPTLRLGANQGLQKSLRPVPVAVVWMGLLHSLAWHALREVLVAGVSNSTDSLSSRRFLAFIFRPGFHSASSGTNFAAIHGIAAAVLGIQSACCLSPSHRPLPPPASCPPPPHSAPPPPPPSAPRRPSALLPSTACPSFPEIPCGLASN